MPLSQRKYLISHFASDAGKKGGEFYTPAEVAILLAKLLQPKSGERISALGRMFNSTAGEKRENIRFPERYYKVPFKGRKLDREKIDQVLKTLTYREREIIKLRYGLGDGYTYTLEEVGRIFKVTRERVRQIEAKAVRKLQHPARSKQLKGFLDSLATGASF